jgi:hypothetical protein
MAKKIVAGLWYKCRKAHDGFYKGVLYYSPKEGMLNCGRTEMAVVDHPEHFTDGMKFDFKIKKGE